jgi:hypothetical protein
VFCFRVCRWRNTVSKEHQDRMYPFGAKVRVLRGELAGQVFTISSCTADEIHFVERLKREAMSKDNVEPVED